MARRSAHRSAGAQGSREWGEGDGGGIYFTGYSFLIIKNCTFSGNSTESTGAAICCWSANPDMVNTIVEGNTGNGAIYLHEALYASLTYGDFFDNEGGHFLGDNIPSGLGQTTTINACGDSCDAYYNIFLDAQFITGPLSDYHLSPD